MERSSRTFYDQHPTTTFFFYCDGCEKLQHATADECLQYAKCANGHRLSKDSLRTVSLKKWEDIKGSLFYCPYCTQDIFVSFMPRCQCSTFGRILPVPQIVQTMTQLCPLCHDPTVDQFVLFTCSCRVCLKCWKYLCKTFLPEQYVLVDEDVGLVLPCQRPGHTNHTMDGRHVYRLVGREFYEDLKDYASKRRIQSLSVHCPTCNVLFCLSNERITRTQCPVCGMNFCKLCSNRVVSCRCNVQPVVAPGGGGRNRQPPPHAVPLGGDSGALEGKVQLMVVDTDNKHNRWSLCADLQETIGDLKRRVSKELLKRPDGEEEEQQIILHVAGSMLKDEKKVEYYHFASFTQVALSLTTTVIPEPEPERNLGTPPPTLTPTPPPTLTPTPPPTLTPTPPPTLAPIPPSPSPPYHTTTTTTTTTTKPFFSITQVPEQEDVIMIEIAQKPNEEERLKNVVFGGHLSTRRCPRDGCGKLVTRYRDHLTHRVTCECTHQWCFLCRLSWTEQKNCDCPIKCPFGQRCCALCPTCKPGLPCKICSGCPACGYF